MAQRRLMTPARAITFSSASTLPAEHNDCVAASPDSILELRFNHPSPQNLDNSSRTHLTYRLAEFPAASEVNPARDPTGKTAPAAAQHLPATTSAASLSDGMASSSRWVGLDMVPDDIMVLLLERIWSNCELNNLRAACTTLRNDVGNSVHTLTQSENQVSQKGASAGFPSLRRLIVTRGCEFTYLFASFASWFIKPRPPPEISSNGLGVNLASFKHLRHLDLVRCKQITDTHMAAITEKVISQLESLTISWCSNLTDASLRTIAEKAPTQLKLLTLEGNKHWTRTGFSSLVGEATPALQELKIRACEGTTDEALVEMARKTPMLRRITVVGGTVTMTGVVAARAGGEARGVEIQVLLQWDMLTVMQDAPRKIVTALVQAAMQSAHTAVEMEEEENGGLFELED